MGNKISVLVVDDSALMRLMISEILNSENGIEVVARAKDGEDAIRKATELKPDVVTMDIEMPCLDGLNALSYIMSEIPTPVIMLSAYTRKASDATFRALEYGAVDFVAKPSGPLSGDIGTIRSELIAKVKTAAGVDLNKLKFIRPKNIAGKYYKAKPWKKIDGTKIVTIGSSTGGPSTLRLILSQLEADMPAGIAIVQHMPRGFTGTFAVRLDSESNLEVKEAEAGDKIEQGKVLVAPGDYHLTIKREMSGRGTSGAVSLGREPPVYGLRPTVDAMMLSAAEVYGDKTIGVILTGMGNDGTKGMRAIKEKGGRTIAQDKDTCVVYGMSKTAIEQGVVDKVLPLNRIAAEIMKML